MPRIGRIGGLGPSAGNDGSGGPTAAGTPARTAIPAAAATPPVPASAGCKVIIAQAPYAGRRHPERVDWTGSCAGIRPLSRDRATFRLLTEPGTREGLKGSFIHNYARAVGGLHGWADGDEFYVNYVGHPMQGSVAGFLWVGNDVRYRHAEFGKNPDYWKGRLRAAAFAWVYSTQFEIGAFSEASIGAIQATPPQQGFVDHVITPTVGMGWMVAEDALGSVPGQTRRSGHLQTGGSVCWRAPE